MQISLAFLGTALGLIQTDKVRALAFASSNRSAALANVPTFTEAGMPEFQYDSWFGILAPAKTPASIVKKISDDLASILKNPEVQNRWESLGAIPVVSSPEQFDATIRSDADRYGRLLKAAGVTPN